MAIAPYPTVFIWSSPQGKPLGVYRPTNAFKHTPHGPEVRLPEGLTGTPAVALKIRSSGLDSPGSRGLPIRPIEMT